MGIVTLILVSIFVFMIAILTNIFGCGLNNGTVEPYNMLTVDCLNKQGRCEPVQPGYHAEFDIWNRLVSVDTTPPCKRGSHSCYQIDCPIALDENLTCWRCDDIVTLPQND